MADRRQAITGFHAGLTGPTWRVAGWGSAALQRIRFDALLRATAYAGGSVLDWGCGPADLYFNLRALNLPLDYAGVDVDPRMVELARRRGAPDVELVGLDFRPRRTYDYVFANGVFQFQDPDDPVYYLDILEAMYDSSARAAAATFLSANRPDEARAADELYVDPATMARVAAAITDHWVLDHSYHPDAGDLTLALLHGPARRRPARPGSRHPHRAGERERGQHDEQRAGEGGHRSRGHG